MICCNGLEMDIATNEARTETFTRAESPMSYQPSLRAKPKGWVSYGPLMRSERPIHNTMTQAFSPLTTEQNRPALAGWAGMNHAFGALTCSRKAAGGIVSIAQPAQRRDLVEGIQQ